MTEAEAGAITRIGFVGLGNMGWPMAHLLDPHFTLTVLDACTEVAESFAAEHRATATTSLEALAEASDAVITMLPNGDIVREVALGGADGGDLVAGMAAGSMLIDMSSSAPLGTRQLAEDLRRPRHHAGRCARLGRGEYAHGTGRCRSWSGASPTTSLAAIRCWSTSAAPSRRWGARGRATP